MSQHTNTTLEDTSLPTPVDNAATTSKDANTDSPISDASHESVRIATPEEDQTERKSESESLTPMEQLEILPLEPVDIESIRNPRAWLTDSAIFHIMFRVMGAKLPTSPIQLVEPTWLAQWFLQGAGKPSELPYFFKPNSECDRVSGLLMPFNINNCHWTCVYVSLEKNYAVLYDSVFSWKNTRLAEDALDAFYETFQDQFRGDHTVRFYLKPALKCQQQVDSSSCGIFTCRFIIDLLNGEEPDDPQDRYLADQQHWRAYFCKELQIPAANDP